MEKILNSVHKIRFQDCDPFNHLNNSKYLEYFINAREDQIEKHYNLDIFKHTKTTGHSWVVGSNQIAYLRPAKIMESVLIRSKLFAFNEHSLDVEMHMYDKSGEELKSVFWTKLFYVNIQSGKLAPHPEQLMDLFATVMLPNEEQSFEQRSYKLRKSYN